MEKFYTLSEVVENMEFGEVAVKVGGYEDDEKRYVRSGMYVFFDEHDKGILKTNRGARLVIAKHLGKERDKFVIMSREAYNKMKNL